MNEYQQLLQRYGVSSQQLPYAGMAKPTDTAAPEYADLMSKYTTDRSAYDKWLDSYKQRIAARSVYDPAFTGETLGTPTYEYGAGYTLPKAPVTPAAPTPAGSGALQMNLEGGQGGRDVDGARANMGNWDTSGRSLTGGLIPGMFQGQAPAPVVDMSTMSAAAAAQAEAEAQAEANREASMSAESSGGGATYGGGADAPGTNADGYGGGDAGFGGGSQAFAKGGLAKMAQRYAVGGPVSGPPNVYQSAEMNRNFSNPDMPMQEDAAVAPMASNEDVAAMFEKYQAPQQPVSPYAQELAAARKTASEQTEAFNQMLQKAISAPGEAAPSKAEMYFQLAAAFGAPTRTGSFTESLGKAGEVMGEQQKAQRAAQKAQRAQALTLGLEGQKMKMQTAKEDLNTLRTLAGEEMKDVRATSLEALKDKRARELEDLKDKRARDLEALREKYKTGAPASEAGKLAADAGLVRGTPEFNKFVSRYIDEKMASGNEYKSIMAGIAQQGLELRQQAGERAAQQAKKLSPQEMKLKTETEDMVAQTDQALANLKQAYSLNANTFDASAVDVAQRKVLEAVGSKDPKVVNTREMENLLEKAALSQLKATFPGAISNDERKALQDVQGLSSKSKEERGLIMKNGYKALKAVRERSAKRLNEINQGLYRDTSTTAGELE